MKRVSATIVKETSEKMRNARIELLIPKEGEHRENVLNPAPSLAIFAPFQQKYLSAGKLAAPVDGSVLDLAGSGLLCCSSLPSDIFIFNWKGGGGNYTPLHVPGKAPERGRMRLPELPPLLRGGGPHGACWPWWL